MNRKIIPDIVEATNILTMGPDDSAEQAAKLMAGKNIAAMIVVDGDGNISGIVTERDLCQKVMAKGVDAAATPVSAIMTANPDTLAPDDSAGDALELMQTRKYRHLPVVADGKCLAVVSVRDLYSAVKEALEEDIRETEAFVFGDRYGA
ncbi:MAG: CBS domain-containing protein [Alphaproteobacteria bacterium]|jgi:CBS domain-containing protein|nr:CBS domain-containing protein [Alphaproteobacteria bacterium]MBT6094197.1 CBS domain-containing protein [Rhodospirillaceae bacterium]